MSYIEDDLFYDYSAYGYDDYDTYYDEYGNEIYCDKSEEEKYREYHSKPKDEYDA